MHQVDLSVYSCVVTFTHVGSRGTESSKLSLDE